jgi:integrase
LLLKRSDILWEERLILVRSNKKKDERFVPIFPEIAQPLAECTATATTDTEWLIDRACPLQHRYGTRTGGMKGANIMSVFDDIVTKAGLPIIPMAGNNLRASAVKDLYSGKYPALRGRIDLIGKIFGHSPQVAMTYYKRFHRDDFRELTETFRAEVRDKSRDALEIMDTDEAGEVAETYKMQHPAR